ncbi:MAG: NADH:ubiquinone oxidoreductase subunit NDUFA12 [Sphingopyxis sp.]
MELLGKLFTWWDGATIGTLLYSARHGRKVGEDALGNRYYESKDGARRWVLYKGANDAARVSPDWHGWLHHSYDGLPDAMLPPPREWQGGAAGNPTGTPSAYRPVGARSMGTHRAAAVGDYQAWTPDA